jgi:hypothetical protein
MNARLQETVILRVNLVGHPDPDIVVTYDIDVDIVSPTPEELKAVEIAGSAASKEMTDRLAERIQQAGLNTYLGSLSLPTTKGPRPR